MPKVFLQKYHAACASGTSIEEVCESLAQNISSLKPRTFQFEEAKDFFVGSFPDEKLRQLSFNELCLKYIRKLNIDFSKADTLLILSTTKGEILSLERDTEAASLHKSVLFFEKELHCANQPLLISNACISGVLALVQAHDFVKAGLYKSIVVCAADLISPFVVSGFNAFQAISPQACTPYDKNRNGVSLGEAVAVALVSSEESEIELLGGATANDANHISGPSRTGEGLMLAIKNALKQSGEPKIDFVSAHGTATVFNDEMESIAFTTLGLQHLPLHSLKGYFGHTLGAAGLLESLVCAEIIKQGVAYKSLGFEEAGTSMPLNILRENKNLEIKTVLKTASGFGGCNGAVVLKKA